MTFRFLILAAALAASSAQAQGMPPEVCDQTAAIVSKAQELRVGGDGVDRAVRKLQRSHKDLGEGFTAQVIPALVSFVYMQDEAQLGEDLGAFWKDQCLTQDLSGALSGQSVSN